MVLPEGLIARLDQESLRWVLLHELAHLARRDHLAELFQRLVGAAFCFHPLVWFANRLTRSYLETACDEVALVRCQRGRPSRCAQALYEVVAHATSLGSRPGAKHRTPHATPLLFHTKELTRKRIMRLVEPHPSLSRGLGVVAILALLFSSAAALSSARFPAYSIAGKAKETPPTSLDIGELTLEDSAQAARLATDWLVQSQASDGGWHYAPPSTTRESDRASRDSVDVPEFEPYHSDVALTALALQALLLGVGAEPAAREASAAITRAVAYLLEAQDPKSGLFGSPEELVLRRGSLAGHAEPLLVLSRLGEIRSRIARPQASREFH